MTKPAAQSGNAPQPPPRFVDPTLPTTAITAQGRQFRMCLNLGALLRAEQELVALGHDEVKLAVAFSSLLTDHLYPVAILFAASVRMFHPEIEFEEARALPDLLDLYEIRRLMTPLWNRSMPAPEPEEETHDEANPTPPGP